jgi:hypothetical protein
VTNWSHRERQPDETIEHMMAHADTADAPRFLQDRKSHLVRVPFREAEIRNVAVSTRAMRPGQAARLSGSPLFGAAPLRAPRRIPGVHGRTVRVEITTA